MERAKSRIALRQISRLTVDFPAIGFRIGRRYPRREIARSHAIELAIEADADRTANPGWSLSLQPVRASRHPLSIGDTDSSLQAWISVDSAFGLNRKFDGMGSSKFRAEDIADRYRNPIAGKSRSNDLLPQGYLAICARSIHRAPTSLTPAPQGAGDLEPTAFR